MPQNIQNPPPGKIINRHWKIKMGGNMTAGAASTGVMIAQMATGTTTLAVLSTAAAGAAVSATGVGLVVTAGALMIGSSVVAARSAKKSYKHRRALREIYAHRDDANLYPCTPVDPTDHNLFHHQVIANEVLPYIISKKSSKAHRKTFAAIPGAGMLESLRAAGKKGWKKLKGTLGENRTNGAMWLANHLLSHDCALAEAIVAELYSHEEMLWIKYHCDGDNAVYFISEKMRST